MPLLTIFTPTYNRAHTLSRTYASLREQTCKDFIWLIIDDGSTDETKSLVRSWQTAEKTFAIEYIYQKNGGMHTAHNTAYQNIHTELNVCIDSDDTMPPDAVELIHEKWSQVKELGYAGLIGLDIDREGNLIGTSFPAGVRETTLSGFYADGGKGDKKLVYRTDVINSVPAYPVFQGEKYVALAYKYLLVDQNHKLCVLNKPLCCVDYRSDGHSQKICQEYLLSPQGFALWRKTCMQYPTSRTRLFIDCVHYVSSSIVSQNRDFLRQSPRKLLTLAAVPFGAALTGFIRFKCGRIP